MPPWWPCKAQLLSWQADGEEQLFLSPLAAHDGHTPIRGGIPVCFPQFNQRGPLVKHGFARTLPWQADAAQAEILAGDGLFLRLRLADTPQTRAVWPHSFETWLEVTLLPGRLDVELVVHNRGDTPLAFTAALHSYLRVADVEQCRLQGLDGLPYWDAVADTHPTQHGDVRFGEELDRVYPRPGNAMELAAPGGGLRISQDAAWTETVVWNPGPALCERLPDMPPQGGGRCCAWRPPPSMRPCMWRPARNGARPSACTSCSSAPALQWKSACEQALFSLGRGGRVSGAACAVPTAQGAGPG